MIGLKSIKNYSQPYSKNTKTPLQSPIGYAVQREIAVYSVTKGGEGGGLLCNDRHYVFYYGGGIRKVYCSEASQAVAARPSGKGKPELM